MASFTTYIAGLHKQLGNNTSPNDLGSISGSTSSSATSSLPPPAPNHAPLTHVPRASTSHSDGPAPLLSQPTSSGNVLRPTQDSSIQHPLTPTSHIPLASASHNSTSTGSPNPQTLPSNNNPSSISPVHSTTSSSQPLPTIHHRSLRRILSQDQQITTSPRKLRNRCKPFLSVN